MQKQSALIYIRRSRAQLYEQIEQSLLRGSITCGYCGRSLMVVGSEYRCSASTNEACRSVAIMRGTIDTPVWNAITTQLGERRTLVYVSDESTSEQKRQILKMLGVTVTLYAENDTAHSRYELKMRVTL